MSTPKQHSTTTVTWQSKSSDLTRSEAALISSHWTEIVRYLAPPGTVWRWGECGISHKVKYRWKDSGLINRAPDGERWQTSEALWCHVISKVADDEVVGAEATGQELLSIDAPQDRESVYLVDTATRRPRPKLQATLDGDTVSISAVRQLRGDNLAARNQSKVPGVNGRDRDAAQTTLATAILYDRSQWDVTTAPDATTGITV